ncbi:MAG: hypothetical protein WBE77_11335 [Candidatus Cybelea sp.]|jgi:hypothetical protein
MTEVRRVRQILRNALLSALLAACSAPSPQQQAEDAELAAVTPLKQRYPVLAGFEVRPATTLIVSLDLQQYIEMEDDEIAAMKRAAVERWRSAWSAAHPHAHAVLEVRFIDFIGRKVATETTKV